MNNTYRIEYTGDEVLKLLQKIDELTKSMGLEIIVSANSATKPGVYAIEVEEMALHDKYRQILLVSNYIDEAGMEYASVFQTLFDAQQGKVKTRKQSYNKEQLKYEWTAWETVGEVDLGNYYTKTEIDTKVSSVYRYKGTVPSPMLLPDTKEVGDVYNTTFAGYVYSVSDKNFTLTGISSSDGESININSEITLTFDKNISEIGSVGFVGTGADIAFWFNINQFFIGKVISFSNNSIVVKIADLDITNTGYYKNPVLDSVQYIFSQFLSGGTASIPIESIRYFAAVEFDFRYEYIPKGGNVAYSGDGGGNQGWDSLGSTIDTSNFATKNELNNKANVSDVYTKSEVDGLLDDKANTSDVYTKSETYTKTEVDYFKNDINNHRNQIRNYPQRTFVNRITDFVQGFRHNQPGAVVKNDADYIVTDSLISFSEGDILHAKTDFDFFLVNTDGSFYKTWVHKDLVFTESKNVYIEIRHSSGKTSLGDVDYIEQEVQSDCINIIDDIASVKDTMDSFNHSFEEVHKYGDSDILQGHHVINGTETETSQPLDCTGFIECKSGDVFLFLYLQSISKYGTKREFISNIGVSALPLYSGNERWNMWVCDFDGYIRCSMWRDETIKYAVTKLNSEPYECVCLGDSIFGNRQKPFDIPTHIQSITKMKTANCAFGGTRASTHSINIYTPLSFWKIADAIYTNDWSEIDVDWNAIANDNVFMVNKKILVDMVDWSKVRVLTVAYGTNDFTGGNAIDNESDKYDCSTYKGALRYGIERILSKYPNITIILLSPLFRYWSNSSDYSTVDEDSDTKLMNGHLLHDFVDAMKAVADEYHLPFFNNYDNLGMNKFNAHSYLSDGTHPSYYDGCEKIGAKIGSEVASVFQRN